MSRTRDIAYFISWCVEQFKHTSGLDGAEAYALLNRYGIVEHLAIHYDVLHTQSPHWLMEELNELLAQRRKEAQA